MKLNLTLIAMFAASLCLGGCGKQMNKAKTPAEALGNYRDAIAAKDKGYFMSCISVADAQKPQAEAWFEFTKAMMELQEAVKKSYGDASLRASNLKSEFPPDNEWVKQLDIKESGDTATAVDKSGVSKEPITLVKDGGVWKLKIELPFDKDKLESATKIVKAAAKNKVGKAGYTPEKIEQEIGDEMAGKTPASQPATAVAAVEKSAATQPTN